MTHWADAYIGAPWASGAQGPDAYDCGGLVRAVQRERFGREIPEVIVDAKDIRQCVRALNDANRPNDWQLTLHEPSEGDCVLLSHSRHPHHVGVWVKDGEKGGVLHALEGIGVIYSDVVALRRNGWSKIEFYRYAGIDSVSA